MEIYSPYKVLHHQDKIELLKKGEFPIPAQVQLDITNICNHNCSYCTYRKESERAENIDFQEKQFIETNRLLKLLEEIKEAGVKAIIIQGGGEPFVHPGIIPVLKKINELGLELGIITNGTKIKQEHLPFIKKASWIRFSIDAASDETYIKVQGCTDNIPKTIIKQIKEENPNIVIGMSFLTKPENYTEAYDFAIMAKELLVDNVRFSIVNTVNEEDIMKDYYEGYFDLIDKASKLQTDKFRVFGLKNRKDALKNCKNYDVCYYQHFVAVIAANGNLYPCCWTKNINEFKIGNINDMSFKEVWLSKLRMDKVLKQDLKKCPSCWFDKTNELMNYHLKKDPKHVNFV